LIGIDRSSVFRLANTLRQRRFLANPQGSKDYILGPTACRRVRADGYAIDDGEYMQEVRCVAAPIRDPQGEIVASVGISSPVTRLDMKRIGRVAAAVVATARAISASLAS
jgi:DNA-binding IclR family transcriptional regulator